MTNNVERNSLYAGASILAGACLAYSGFTQTGSTIMAGGIGALGYNHIDKIANGCLSLIRFHYTRSSPETKNKIQTAVLLAGTLSLAVPVVNTFWHFDPIRLSNVVAGAMVYGTYCLNNQLEKISPSPAPRPTPKPFNFVTPDRGNFSRQIDELRKIVLNNPEDGRKFNLVMQAHNDAYKEWGKPKDFEKDFNILVDIYHVIKGTKNKEILRKDPRTPSPRPVVQEPTLPHPLTERELTEKVQKRFAEAYSRGEPGPERYNSTVKLVTEKITLGDQRYPQQDTDRELLESLSKNGEDLSKLKKGAVFTSIVPQLVQTELRPTKQRMDDILSMNTASPMVARCDIQGLDESRSVMESVKEVERRKRQKRDKDKSTVTKISLKPDEEKESRAPNAPTEKGSRPSLFTVMRELRKRDKQTAKIEKICKKKVDLYEDSEPELSFLEEDEGTGDYIYSRVERLGGLLVGGGAEHIARRQGIYMEMYKDYEARLKKAKGAVPKDIHQLLPLLKRAIEADLSEKPSILKQLDELIQGPRDVRAIE